MREIKFKGKRPNSGKWITGGYIQKGIFAYILGNDHFEIECSTEVLPETVSQFTGLREAGGKEIYEGDIVYFTVFDYNDHDTQYKGVIVYYGSRFMIWKSAEDEFYGSNGGFDLDWVVGQDDEIEVIGNIYETPELLKEANNAP